MKDATVQEAEKPIICLLGSFNPGERSQEIADPFGVSKVVILEVSALIFVVI